LKDDDYAEEFKVIMISRDYDAAMRLYEYIKASGEVPKGNLLSGLMTVCHLKEHLDSAITLFKEYSLIGYPPNESAYMSLIRCYADNGQIDVALSLIDEMKKHSMEMRLRAYHPIMEAAAKLGDHNSAILAMKGMTSENVVPRAEHFVLLIEAVAKSGTIGESSSVEEIDKMLRDETFNLTDLNREGLVRIVAAFRGISENDVAKEGVLAKYGRSFSFPREHSAERSSNKASENRSDFAVEWNDSDKVLFDARHRSVPVSEGDYVSSYYIPLLPIISYLITHAF
jgi:pentatricopeptide repeat protein